MNLRFVLLTAAALSLVFVCPLQAQVDSNAESIDKMKQRIEQIEKEMQDVDTGLAQELGEEAFSLFGQIDQTFFQLKSTYQQQVIELNRRMQRKWEKIESAKSEDRDEIARQLVQLEKDWDRTYDRLTEIHDEHFQQLKDSLAKVRGEFSEVAGKAQSELEASNFEARSRWEKGHEIFLRVNKTYVGIVGDQLQWLERYTKENPGDIKSASELAETRHRYAALQKRLQKRIAGHIGHLEDELETRLAQLEVTRVWEPRRIIYKSIDELYERTQSTFESLQSCMRDSLSVFVSEQDDATTSKKRKDELGISIRQTATTLKSSYLARMKFIDAECDELDRRIAGSAKAEEKATWNAKVTELRLLANNLRQQAADLNAVQQPRTARR